MTDKDPAVDPELLIPWYLNGTLDDADRQRVEAFLGENPAAGAEVEFLGQVRGAVRDYQPGSPGEFGLARLRSRIAEQESRDGSRRPGVWRLAAAVAMMAVVVQGGLLYRVSQQDDGYRPLGQEPGTAGIRVMFDEAATAGQIRDLLLDAGLEIRGGPGALGFYELDFVAEADPDERRQALRQLRAAASLVEELEVDPALEAGGD